MLHTRDWRNNKSQGTRSRITGSDFQKRIIMSVGPHTPHTRTVQRTRTCISESNKTQEREANVQTVGNKSPFMMTRISYWQVRENNEVQKTSTAELEAGQASNSNRREQSTVVEQSSAFASSIAEQNARMSGKRTRQTHITLCNPVISSTHNHSTTLMDGSSRKRGEARRDGGGGDTDADGSSGSRTSSRAVFACGARNGTAALAEGTLWLEGPSPRRQDVGWPSEERNCDNVCVCVCVCERERERAQTRSVSGKRW